MPVCQFLTPPFTPSLFFSLHQTNIVVKEKKKSSWVEGKECGAEKLNKSISRWASERPKGLLSLQPMAGSTPACVTHTPFRLEPYGREKGWARGREGVRERTEEFSDPYLRKSLVVCSHTHSQGRERDLPL